MRFKLKQLDRNIELIFTDSKEHNKVKNNYLPRGLMNCIRGKVINLYNQEKAKIDNKGK